MIHPAIVDAIQTAKVEGRMRPVRFVEKGLRDQGYVLSQEEEDALDEASTNGGRKPNRDEHGFTPHQNKLADGFDLYWKYVREGGMRRVDARALVCNEMNIKETVLVDVLAKRRKDVNIVLRARNSI